MAGRRGASRIVTTKNPTGSIQTFNSNNILHISVFVHIFRMLIVSILCLPNLPHAHFSFMLAHTPIFGTLEALQAKCPQNGTSELDISYH